MPSLIRSKTAYPGVFFIDGISTATGKPERIYYIRYRRNGKLIEEKAGRQHQDDMTPAKAARLRAQRIEGDDLSNRGRREAIEAAKEAELHRWTINRLWEEYKASRPDLKGVVTDDNRFNNYIKPAFGEREPAGLAPLDVDRLRLGLLKRLSPGTVKNVLELLRRIINFGVKKNLCDPPRFTVELPKADSLKTEDLTPEELVRLIKAMDEEPNVQAANLMRLALYTGMRRGELFKLRWDDLDFERGFILLREPKGGRDQKIPMSELARILLMGHPRLNDSPYVFPGRDGERRVDIKKQVNRIKERAGLPADFRALHGLRHVYASMLASSGKVDMYTLQKLLTHKSPQMTQRYAHLRDDALKRACDVAGEILGSLPVESESEKCQPGQVVMLKGGGRSKA